MRARRIMSGIRRIGMVAALILSLPLLFGLWTWVTLGHAPPRYVYVLLVIGLGAHIVATSIGWIMAGFADEDESQSM